MDTSQSSGMDAKKSPLDSMSKEELLKKYKGLLGIAKQAKTAKDEFAEENQKLKDQLAHYETQREADKKSLLTMKEMLEEFTNNKLEMSTELSELRSQNKCLLEEGMAHAGDVEKLSIENEALRRQVDRLSEDNESLLTDIDQMEQQLKQVNVLGIEQKKHLDLLELEVEKLKNCEEVCRRLETELYEVIESKRVLEESYTESQQETQSLTAKYQSLKVVNSEQRSKFNGLKERFIEVHKKLRQLQECKRVLVESHHEYSDSITRWQLEIMHASEKLCGHIQTLSEENTELKRAMQADGHGNVSVVLSQLPPLIAYCDQALVEYKRQNDLIETLKRANEELRSGNGEDNGLQNAELQSLTLQNEILKEEISKLKLSFGEEINQLKAENARLHEEILTEHNDTSQTDEISQLRSDNQRLTEEITNARICFDERIKSATDTGVKTVEEATIRNRDLCEEAAKAKELLEEEIQRLLADNLRLGQELANTKLCLESELTRLKTENKNLGDEATHHRLTSTSLEKELSEVKLSGQELQFRLDGKKAELKGADSILALRLPILIDCCERAVQEHQQLSKEVSLISENERLTDEIDRLKAELSGLKSTETDVQEVIQLRDNLVKTTNLCEDLQTKLEKQERENTDLLNEMRELNEALKGRGDVISRQQAKHQELVTEMKKTSSALAKFEADLSAKDVLIKEKETKLAKMSEDNKAALQEVNRLQNVSRENESRIKTLSEEIAAMRSQIEANDTQSEVLSTSTISRAEELARLREVDESFEEKYNKLRSLAVKLKKKAHEQSLGIADLEKQLADAKAKISESNERISSLENERESLNKDLKTCKNQMEALKAEVDKLKSSKKQSNVLTLEIEAFEKSLNETSAKLSAKCAEYDLLRDTLQSKDAAIEVMRKEIKILEDSQESEKLHSMELKKQIDKLQSQLKDIIHSKQELSTKLDECQSEKQSLQSDLQEVSQRLSVIADEREAERAKVLQEKENLQQTINSLGDELIASNNRITLAERSFEDLIQEYTNYKLKAQSVLRQTQTKESSKERELEEELSLVKGEHQQLTDRLQTFQEKIHANEKTIEELAEQNRCLSNRNSELTNTIADLRHQAEVLSQDNRKQIETYQDTLKGHRLQIEALNECHLQQLQDWQAKYEREVAALKTSHRKDPEVVAQKPLEKLDYIHMEREDAEGSEAETTHTPKYLPSSAKRSVHDMVPLDELLSSPSVDYAVLERRPSISPSIELQETKDRLHKQESRVRHLTSLLAESEQDLARLTQLNEMLKEEVRRQERTVEREKHMHNSEYLKNVVLKFVSLNNGDERTRLVPVLNTILKLSPSETEMLQNVAKGKAVDNNNRSWGSFLPHWGGTS